MLLGVMHMLAHLLSFKNKAAFIVLSLLMVYCPSCLEYIKPHPHHGFDAFLIDCLSLSYKILLLDKVKLSASNTHYFLSDSESRRYKKLH